jgi:hypothetical protein
MTDDIWPLLTSWLTAGDRSVGMAPTEGGAVFIVLVESLGDDTLCAYIDCGAIERPLIDVTRHAMGALRLALEMGVGTELTAQGVLH